MVSYSSITHEIDPLQWPDTPTEIREPKEVQLKWQQEEPQTEEQDSQTTSLQQEPVPIEMVALQCFGAGVAVGLLLCYFLRSNQE